MINIQFYQDQDGYFKADADVEYALLSQYFESEVQGIPEVCQDLLDAIQEIEDGTLVELAGIGNAIGLKVTGQQVILWDEFAESPQELAIALKDFRKLLENCLFAINASSQF